MGQVAADRGLVSDPHRGDTRERLGERGAVGGHVRRALRLAVGGQRADLKTSIGGAAHATQLGDGPQADDVSGLDEALPHHQHQRGAAGHQVGVLAVPAEEVDRFGHGRGGVEIERRRHQATPAVSGWAGAPLAAASIESTIL